MLLAQITFNVNEKERKSFLNIIHTCMGNKLPCYIRHFVKFILPNSRHESGWSHRKHCDAMQVQKLTQSNLSKELQTNQKSPSPILEH